MANLNFTIEGNSIAVTIGGTGAISAGFKRDKFTANGVLTAFTLTYTPISDSLLVLLNGIPQEYAVDYTLSGKIITFATAPDDTWKIEAMYAYGQQAVYQSFTPRYDKFAGTGAQTVFALSYTRLANTLGVYIDGILKELDVDYTETGSGASITFTSAPYSGAVIEAKYAQA